MSDNLIEIAEQNGAIHVNFTDAFTKHKRIIFDSEQELRATIEQVCAPLVKSMNEAVDVIESVIEAQGRKACLAEDLLILNLKIEVANYRALIGDKE